MRQVAPVALGLFVLIVLACSGGSDSGPGETPTAGSTATVAPTPTAPAATTTVTAVATGTGTATPPGVAVEDMPLDVRVGQLIFTGLPGTTVGAEAERLLGTLHMGNVVVMGENAGTPTQVAAFTSAVQELAERNNGVGALIATDQEGGLVQRLTEGFTRLPDAASVGSAGRPDLARQYGEMVGDELRAVGVNMALGPVLDVNDNPANPVIGRRAFGSTVETVVATGLPYIEGLHAAGVVAVGKHYPGHGNTETDSHFTLPVVRKTLDQLEATELAPFEAAVAAGLDAVMVAHVAYPALDPSGMPASLSAVIGAMLKEHLGVRGIVVTDDLGMAGVAALMPSEEAALRAVQAGADLLICVSLPCDATLVHARLMRAVATGELSASRLNDAVRRVLELKERHGIGVRWNGSLDAVGSPAHRAVIEEILAAGG
ncbi:MAG: beta-N-acetylhexosaminidase [Dehalococcoidia bacterium]